MQFSGLLSLVAHMESFPIIVGAGFYTYLIFKRTETHNPIHIFALLIVIPAVLTALLARRFSSIIVAGGTTFLLFWSTLIASVLLYRFSPWHPLASYPGPLLCKISKLWLAFVSLRGKQHVYYAELHRRYGDVVRIGPNELSFRDAAAVAPMMGPQGFPKGPFWDGRIPETQIVKPMIAVRNKIEHTRRRRPWTRAFSTSALKNYEPIITKRCAQLIERLSEQKGAVDLAKWISFFTYDFMTDLAFGGGSEMMRAGRDEDGLWELLESGQKISLFMSHVPWAGALFFRFPGVAKDLKVFRQYAKRIATMRKENGSPYKDIFHYLLDEDGVFDNPANPTEVLSDAGLAIIAGSDTTSSALANLFYFLLSNPTAYKRLQSEIDERDDDLFDFSKQSSMLYLNAAINESLRLFPPVLSGSQRHTKEGRVIGEHYVPEGTSTSVPHFSIHRDPRYFSPLPDMFLPERWLPPNQQIALEPGLFKDQRSVILDQRAFIPFSVGPSNCVGKNLAYMEMRMLVCTILRRFELSFEEGYHPKQWERELCDYFVTVKGRLPVVLTPRM